MAFQDKQNDLVLATHGRGIIIIDDLTPLRHFNQSVLEQEFAFLPVRPYYFHPKLIPRIILAMLNSPDQVKLPPLLSVIISKKDIRSVKCILMYMIPPGSL